MMSIYSPAQTKTESKKGKSSSIIRLSRLHCIDWAIIPFVLYLGCLLTLNFEVTLFGLFAAMSKSFRRINFIFLSTVN